MQLAGRVDVWISYLNVFYWFDYVKNIKQTLKYKNKEKREHIYVYDQPTCYVILPILKRKTQ